MTKKCDQFGLMRDECEWSIGTKSETNVSDQLVLKMRQMWLNNWTKSETKMWTIELKEMRQMWVTNTD